MSARGDRVELDVTGLSHGPAAIARHEGKVVFVGPAAPGDRVQALITKVHKSYLRAEVEHVLDTGPARVTPFCPLATQCGGCDWQHVGYAQQVAAKAETLARAVRNAPIAPKPLLEAQTTRGYRCRARLHFEVDQHTCQIGFYGSKSNRIVDVEHCPVLNAPLNAALGVLRGWLATQPPARGSVVLLAGEGGTVHASIQADRAVIDLEALIQPPLVGATLRNANQAAGATAITLVGEVAGSAAHFWQANAEQNAHLRRLVVELAGIRAEDRVLELYAGIGNLTAPLAAQAGLVVAVERGDPQPLRQNCQGLSVEIHDRDVTSYLSELRDQNAKFDVVVLDPPREGVGKSIAVIAELKPRTVVYVSCDPQTLARDLNTLRDAGYSETSIQGIDMMPHTHHLEAIVALHRIG